MTELFEEALRAHRERGWLPWASAWFKGTVDVALLAIRLRLRPTSGRWAGRMDLGFLGSFLKDVLFSVRTLRRRRLYTVVAVLTLGLGIGAATAMFSVVDGVLLKPLPYREPERLVAIWQTRPDRQSLPGIEGSLWDRTRLTYLQYSALVEESTLYGGLAAYRGGIGDVAIMTGAGEPVELPAGAASASLLPLLGLQPTAGRWFLPGEDGSRAGTDGASVAVISHELWVSRFGARAGVLGSSLILNDHPFTIVGVLPPGFKVSWLSSVFAGEGDAERRDVWFPVGAPGWEAHPQATSWEVVGRLDPGATLAGADAETRSLLSGHPDTHGEIGVYSRPAEEKRGLAGPLVLLLGATGFLLLIACANIATLAMAEFQGRRHEIATRSAIGAGSWRIVRMLLTECLVLAFVGSAVGAMLSFGATKVLVALAPQVPRLHEVGVDLRVLGFSILLGSLAAILFGAVPSILASRLTSGPILIGSRGAGQIRRRFAGAVMGTEIALTVMLLVAGGLLTRSLTRLLAVDPGFDFQDLATVEVKLPTSRYGEREARAAFFRDALHRLESIPGIGLVTGVSRLPFPGKTSNWGMRIVSRDQRVTPLGYQVAPGYLETMGVPLLAGRALDAEDGPDTPPVAVINETMARRYWPDTSPLGETMKWGGSSEPLTVVGIVGDMKRQELSSEAEPAFYIPFTQLPDETVCFVARTRMDPDEALPLMRNAVRSVDPGLVVKNATTVASLVVRSVAEQRYRTLLMNAFGVLAALLAAAGVVGVTARRVSLRTRELGIKMALGARGSDLVRATVGGNLRIALGGTALGVLGALWASSLLSGVLFGIETTDPATYVFVAASILGLTLGASYLPARRISRVNAMDVLRTE